MGTDYLNLGSGQRPFAPPWINWDVQVDKWKKFTEEKECLWGAPWAEGKYYDIICLHHVIEHFGCGEADELISDCHAKLNTGGSLLVFVPDIRLLSQRWLVHQLETQVYMTNLYGAYMGDEADRHKWGYDRESLKEYLGKFSWKAVKPFDWREIEGADIARDWYIIGMECVK